ncbi:MAG: 2-succinyl-5-enolpyruvyl-6-hydroxy-3-cyclohexene-1-carboxylic-acid synthase [Myxococcales bacterium]|nr:2-succinyl-5-enolpyruvyl-6-hydroxy-3-cyclohexene-1-carboxylic-acid synthase [Myxococcales bacterium]
MEDPMRTAQANARGAGLLVAALVEGGVRAAVISPGSRNTPLVLALTARPEVQAWPVLDERSAAFFALGLARASGRPVVLACTSGSAGAHYLPALIEAERSGVPLVVLTADRPPELHDCGAPQTIDQRRLFGGFVRASIDVPPPEPLPEPRALRSVGAMALARALGPPAGPVHLNLGFRAPLWLPGVSPVMEPPYASAETRLRGAPTLDEAALKGLAGRLSAARRGVIVCGPDAADGPGFGAAVGALADALGWPLLAEPSSGARFGVAGVVTACDALLRTAAPRLVPDLILRFGHGPTSKALAAWLAGHGVDRTVLVAPDGERHDPMHAAATVVVTAATALAQALTPRVIRGAKPAWKTQWQRLQAQAEAVLAVECATGEWEGAIARTLVEALPANAALHVASSMPVRDLDAFAPPRATPLRVFASRGANGIDGTLSTAVGEAAAAGPLALLTGDLAFLHDLGGLFVAAATGARLTVVLVDNGGGGIFGFLPIAAHGERFERWFATPQEADFAALCAGAGVRFQDVPSLSALPAALAEALPREMSTTIGPLN